MHLNTVKSLHLNDPPKSPERPPKFLKAAECRLSRRLSETFLFGTADMPQWIAIASSIRTVYSNPLPVAVSQKKRTVGISEPIQDIDNYAK